jgi:dihydrofolate reductase
VTQLIYDVSMSLDGFTTGPNVRPEEPMGDGGEALHEWMAGRTDFHDRGGGTDAAHVDVRAELSERLGAVVVGRGTFDLGEQPWGDPPPFGVPVFVVTHRTRATEVKQGGTTYTFVIDGITAALDQARAAAAGKDVLILGGATVFQEYFRAGLVDELQIHLVPVLLHAGVRMLENLGDSNARLERTRVIESTSVTHLRFRVIR